MYLRSDKQDKWWPDCHSARLVQHANKLKLDQRTFFSWAQTLSGIIGAQTFLRHEVPQPYFYQSVLRP